VLDIIRLTIILLVISALAALAIAFTYSKTAPIIQIQKQMEQSQALKEVFPETITIETSVGSSPLPQKYWTGKNPDGSVFGYAFEISERGYSSDIKSILSVKPDGTISGMKIFPTSETPGLGTRVTESVSTAYLWNSLFKPGEKTSPWFPRQFKGLSVIDRISIRTKGDEWHKKNDADRIILLKENAVTAITGATISTNAVVNSISSNVPVYLKELSKSSAVSAPVTDSTKTDVPE
jgi:electron transport complex protein RnfG